MATCLIHIPHLFPFPPPSLSYPLVISFFTARVTPHENVTAAMLSYAVSHLHEGTGKLRKTCADTVGHLTVCPQSNSLWKMTSHPNDIQVLTQRNAAWAGWSPGTGHLPHTEHCRCENSISRYKTRKRAVRALRVWNAARTHSRGR